MRTYISLLRGINVSGHKIIKMDALRAMFCAMKFEDVRTYIQSGNVVFRSPESDQMDLARRIKEKILDEFGFDVPVMVVGRDELRSVLENNRRRLAAPPFAVTRKPITNRSRHDADTERRR